jgi:hypothetical protein
MICTWTPTARRARWPLSAWIVLSLASVCAIGHAADAPRSPFRGPADLRSQRPYQLLFLAFPPESARVMPAGASRQALQLDLASDQLIPKAESGVAVEEDTETQRLSWSTRRGLGRGFEAGLSIPILARNGGVLDKIILFDHQALGFASSTQDIAPGRSNVPSFRSVLTVQRPDGTLAVDAHPAFGVGDTSLFVKRALMSDGRRAVSLRAGVKLPTGDARRLLGSGGFDTGLDLDVDIALSGRVGLFVNFGEVWMGRAPHLAGLAERRMGRNVIAFEYVADRRSSWVLQRDSSQTAVRTGNAFADGTQSTLSLVYKRDAGRVDTWTYAVTENGDFINFGAPWVANIAPDLTVSVGWETRR